MDPGVLSGILALAGTTAAMALVVGAFLCRAELDAAWRRLLERRRRRQQGPSPMGRPIEDVAADLARLRSQVLHPPPGTPEARREGWRRAYDDVLAEGCRALGVVDLLDTIPPGTERDAERLRIEYLLDLAGLHLSDPAA